MGLYFQKRQQRQPTSLERNLPSYGVFGPKQPDVSAIEYQPQQSVIEQPQIVPEERKPSFLERIEPYIGKPEEEYFKGFQPEKGWEEMSMYEKAKATKQEAMHTIWQHGLRELTETTINLPSVVGGLIQKGWTVRRAITPEVITDWEDKTMGFKDAEKKVIDSLVGFSRRTRGEMGEALEPETYSREDNIFDNPKLLINPEYITSAIGGQLPYWALMAGAGKTVGRAGVYVAATLLEGGEEMANRIEAKRAKGEEVSVKDVVFSDTIGLINGVIEGMGFEAIFSADPGIRKTISKGAISKLGKTLETIGEIGLRTAIESGGEYMQEFIPTLAAYIIYQEGENLMEAVKRGHEQGKIAASKAIVAAGPMATITTLQQQQGPPGIERGAAPKTKGDQAGLIYRTLLQDQQHYAELGYDLTTQENINKFVKSRSSDVTGKIRMDIGKAEANFVEAGLKGKTFNTVQQFTNTIEGLIKQALSPTETSNFTEALQRTPVIEAAPFVTERKEAPETAKEAARIIDTLPDEVADVVRRGTTGPLTQNDVTGFNETERQMAEIALEQAKEVEGVDAKIVDANLDVVRTEKVAVPPTEEVGAKQVDHTRTLLKDLGPIDKVKIAEDNFDDMQQVATELDTAIKNSTGATRNQFVEAKNVLNEKIGEFKNLRMAKVEKKEKVPKEKIKVKTKKVSAKEIPKVKGKGLVLEIMAKSPKTQEFVAKAISPIAIGNLTPKPAFTAEKLRGLYMKSKEFKARPVLIVSKKDGKKTLGFKGPTTSFKIFAKGLGLAEDRLKVGDKIKFSPALPKKEGKVVKPKEKTVRVTKKGKMYAEPEAVGAVPVGKFEKVSPGKTTSQKKIFKFAEQLIRKYAERIGEGHLPRKAAGVYFPSTQNIRISGMNALSTLIHEIAHYLDIGKLQLSKRVIADTSRGDKTRKRITDIYEQYYPGGTRKHPLRKRIIEGFAVLVQKYAESPTTITKQYPDLVKMFLLPGGKYYNPVFTEIIKDVRGFIKDYQGLSALDKVGSRIADEDFRPSRESFLNFKEKFRTEVADNIYPIELLAMRTGVHWTKKDPSLYARLHNTGLPTMIINNIFGSKGYYGFRGGGMIKLHDFNWKDLVDDLIMSKETDSFGFYLAARRTYFDYKALEDITSSVNKAELKDLLRRDGITKEEAKKAYLENKDRFKKQEEMYDTLTDEDLKFLKDPDVQILNPSDYSELKERGGYAPFKRAFYDEIVDSENYRKRNTIRVGKGQVSSLIRRRGSSRSIINPLYGAILNHAEIQRKGLKQIVYNKIGDLAQYLPEVFQKTPIKAVPAYGGKFTFPQEKSSDILMARRNYKRVAFVTDKLVKKTIEEVLDFEGVGIFEQLMLGSSRLFTKGTTGKFAQFTFTNYFVDQLTAGLNTRNKYRPIYSSIKEISKAAAGRYGKEKENLESKYLLEYLTMGGERQTIVGWQNLSPAELFEKIKKERNGLGRAIDFLDKGGDILSFPAKWSEIVTRASEYIKARKAGKPQIVALEEAGRVTAPFHHIGRWGKGTAGKTYIKSLVFTNAGIQVLEQAFRTMGESAAGRNRYAFGLIATTASLVASLAAMALAGSDDQKELYKDLSGEEMSRYIWFPNPDGKTLIKVRIPEQMAFLGTVINMAVMDRITNTRYKAGDYFSAAVAFLPRQFDIAEPTRALVNLFPQLMKPLILMAFNKKDFPKVIPLESQTQQGKIPGERYYDSTSLLAKFIGKKLNISPIKIDFLLTGYFGRFIGYFTGKPGAFVPWSPFVRKNYFSSGRRLNEYYDLKEKNDQEYRSYKNKLPKPKNWSEITSTRSKLKGVTSLLKEYRDINIEKSPERAKRQRKRILNELDKLFKD